MYKKIVETDDDIKAKGGENGTLKDTATNTETCKVKELKACIIKIFIVITPFLSHAVTWHAVI